jgi:predicted enzyme related to lactoylglutathione lyase
MAADTPTVPKGNGSSHITLVALSAGDVAASTAFYARVFGWHLQPLTSELTGAMTPAGPMAALRANVPTGTPGMIPFIGVSDVDEALARVIGAGGTVETPTWSIPMAKLARFKDPTGTIYGLTDSSSPAAQQHVPMPFGSNPAPPAGSICSVEMYAAEGDVAAKFFNDVFGWGAAATMPQFMAFDPGAGIGGVFQSHTPATPAVAYIYATDVAAKLDEIDAAGGSRMGEAMRVPGLACFGYFADPSKTTMGLIGP